MYNNANEQAGPMNKGGRDFKGWRWGVSRQKGMKKYTLTLEVLAFCICVVWGFFLLLKAAL